MPQNNPTESLKQALQAFELALADLNGAIRAQSDDTDDRSTANALRDLRSELAGNVVRIRAILSDAAKLAPTKAPAAEVALVLTASDGVAPDAARDLAIARAPTVKMDAGQLAELALASGVKVRFARTTTQQTMRIERQTMAELVASANASAGRK